MTLRKINIVYESTNEKNLKEVIENIIKMSRFHNK